MLKNFLLLFLALRAADVLNLAGGIWLVPKFVAPGELGGILPLTSFATVLSIPLFAIAMIALRESARLRALHEPSRAFVRGVFAAVGIVTVLVLTVSAAILPRYLARLHLADPLSGGLAVGAAFLGCVSPVYLDQLQAARRFGVFGAVEFSAAALRLSAMWLLMPLRALAGYYAGGVVRTLVQILGPVVALRADAGRDRSDAASGNAAAPYWTRAVLLRLAREFAPLVVSLALPMIVSFAENDLIRTSLTEADSAGYYMATRISDLFNAVTAPLLLVMFPYVTERSARGESCAPVVRRGLAVIAAVAAAAATAVVLRGPQLIALLPHGEGYTGYAGHLPLLVAFMAFGAAQTVITNAEIAAGRYSFLVWFGPLNLGYLALLPRLFDEPSLGRLIAVFTGFAALRLLFALGHRYARGWAIAY